MKSHIHRRWIFNRRLALTLLFAVSLFEGTANADWILNDSGESVWNGVETRPEKRAQIVFDFTSLVKTRLTGYDICKTEYNPTTVTQSGRKIKLLGMATVYFGPGFASSFFGHVGERFIYCQDDILQDVLFDYMPYDPTSDIDFKSQYGAHATPEYMKTLEGKFYIRWDQDVSLRYGLHQVGYNRDVYELWLDLSEKQMYETLLRARKRYLDQSALVEQGKPLPEYHLLTQDCTTPVLTDHRALGAPYTPDGVDSLTPSLLFDYLRNQTILQFVSYPSQRSFRKIRMERSGESTFLEYVAPFSQASDGARTQGFILVYSDVEEFWQHLVLSPFVGAANLVAGAGEVVYGLVTTPTNLMSNISALDFLKAKGGGIERVVQGIVDIGVSVLEFFGLRTRYPSATDWSDEERAFLNEQVTRLEPALVPFLRERVKQ